MTYLALHAIGASPEEVARFAASYRERLAPRPPAQGILTADDWHLQLGNADGYAALVAFFDAAIAERGWPAVLDRYLPVLISGLVRGAFHPLIRLAYGIQFEVPEEVAAGLAFMACTGIDERLVRASQREPLAVDASDYLKRWQAHRDPAFAAGRFDARYDRVLDAVCLQPVASASGTGFSSISRACLEVFHATHDFFALHLVTGSHAFRVCAPWAGPDPERLLGVAVAAAYLAVGAPHFGPIDAGSADLPMRELAFANDEHLIKLAYSCGEQARAHADAAYTWVAAQYLMPRLGLA